MSKKLSEITIEIPGEVVPISFSEGISSEVFTSLILLQNRCINCGSTYALQIHHRIFRSEGERELRKFLIEQAKCYEHCYGRPFTIWHLHDIQNLCVLCKKCHEEDVVGVHGGNEKLRKALKYSFTCPVTGFNIPFYKKTVL